MYSSPKFATSSPTAPLDSLRKLEPARLSNSGEGELDSGGPIHRHLPPERVIVHRFGSVCGNESGRREVGGEEATADVEVAVGLVAHGDVRKLDRAAHRTIRIRTDNRAPSELRRVSVAAGLPQTRSLGHR